MQFIAAARDQISKLPIKDPTRLTLEFLIKKAIGSSNAVGTTKVIEHLKQKGLSMGVSQFQTSILWKSRRGRVFIGSNNKGIFLIKTMADAKSASAFYRQKIKGEKASLDRLRALARTEGWNAI